MDAATRELVRRRADERCEYCRLRQDDSELAHHLEHIVAKQHGGSDDRNNLALACHRCNLHKGPNLTGVDSLTGRWRRYFIRVMITGLITSFSTVRALMASV